MEKRIYQAMVPIAEEVFNAIEDPNLTSKIYSVADADKILEDDKRAYREYFEERMLAKAAKREFNKLSPEPKKLPMDLFYSVAEMSVDNFKFSFPKCRVFEMMHGYERYVPSDERLQLQRKVPTITEYTDRFWVSVPKAYVSLFKLSKDDELRPAMSHIFMDVTNGTAVASDCHAIMRCPIQPRVNEKLAQPVSAMIPRAVWKLMCGHDSVVTLYSIGTENFCEVRIDNGDIHNFPQNCRYPRFQPYFEAALCEDGLLHINPDFTKSLIGTLKTYRKMNRRETDYHLCGAEFSVRRGERSAKLYLPGNSDVYPIVPASEVNVPLLVPAKCNLYTWLPIRVMSEMPPEWDGRILVNRPSDTIYLGTKNGSAICTLPCQEPGNVELHGIRFDGLSSTSGVEYIMDYTRAHEPSVINGEPQVIAPKESIKKETANKVKQTKTPAKEQDNQEIMAIEATKKSAYALENLEKGIYPVSTTSSNAEDKAMIRCIAHFLREDAKAHANEPDYHLQADFITAFCNHLRADRKRLPLAEEELAAYMAIALCEDLGIDDIPDYTEDELDGKLSATAPEPEPQPEPQPEPTPQPAPEPIQEPIEEPTEEEPVEEEPVTDELTEEPTEEPIESAVRKMYHRIVTTYPDSIILFGGILPGYYGAIFEDAYLLSQILDKDLLDDDSNYPMLCLADWQLDGALRRLFDEGKRVVFLKWSDYAPAVTDKLSEPEPEAPADETPDIRVVRSSVNLGRHIIRTLKITTDDTVITVVGNSTQDFFIDAKGAYVSQRAEEIFDTIDAFIPDELVNADKINVAKVMRAVEHFLESVSRLAN